MANVRVRIVTDTRLAGLMALARRFATDKRGVLVGVPAGPAEGDGATVAMIAAVHEFGVESLNIPERSFLRGGILHSLPALIDLNVNSLKRIARGDITFGTALALLGSAAAGAVKREITEGTFAPLAQSTIDRKGSSKPLIDTGQLRQSITYQISGEAGDAHTSEAHP